MYTSRYYTCEQIDQRLLQNYLDDYNTQNNTHLTKEEFLTKLNQYLEDKYLSVKSQQGLTQAEKTMALNNLGLSLEDIFSELGKHKIRFTNPEDEPVGFIGASSTGDSLLIQTPMYDGSDNSKPITIRAKENKVHIISEHDDGENTPTRSMISISEYPNQSKGIWLKAHCPKSDNDTGASVHVGYSDVNIKADNYVNIKADNYVNIKKSCSYEMSNSYSPAFIGATVNNLYVIQGSADDGLTHKVVIGATEYADHSESALRDRVLSFNDDTLYSSRIVVEPQKIKTEAQVINIKARDKSNQTNPSQHSGITLSYGKYANQKFIKFYQQEGVFQFKYKKNGQDVVLDLLAKIAELEQRIATLEGNS